MNQAIELTASELDVGVKEFCVGGESVDTMFAHHWFIGTEDLVEAKEFERVLDSNLKRLNDDYAVERSAALIEVRVEVLPVAIFYDWLKNQGKTGGQYKFPRVLSGKRLLEWKKFRMAYK
jgi:hypothetical protein